jgi:hypothetical protein
LPFFWTLIDDINNRGDIVGSGGPDYFNIEGTFLLERIDSKRLAPDVANDTASE